MILTQEAIHEFKDIYKKVYKEELSDKQAFEMANNLLNLYKAVYGTNSSICKNPGNENYLLKNQKVIVE
jgi:hypothetical protein